MNCEYCAFYDGSIDAKETYLLHMVLHHGDESDSNDKEPKALPRYEGKQVYQMTPEKLRVLQKVSKQYVGRKFTRTCCKTCLLPFRLDEIVITAPGSRSLRHLSCAKRVLYV